MRLVLGVLSAVLLMVPRTSAAQAPNPYGPPKPPRIFVDVNLLGIAKAQGHARQFENYDVKFGEVASFSASYPEPSHAGAYPAYLGGGFMFTPAVGIGVSYSRTSWKNSVRLFAGVPDPAFFNALGRNTGSTDTLSRDESAVHISFTVVPYRTNRMEFRLMGGPSFFTLKADMVEAIAYEQTYNGVAPQNSVAITGFSSREASGSQFGFHVGTDFTYFVHRFLGVSAGIRFGQATVDLDEPLSQLRQSLRVGSGTVFLGLRFRLGRAHVDD